MNIRLAEQTLREFVEYFSEVDGVVLVSTQGQLITPSIGIEENTSLIVAGTLLQVSNRIAQECAWQKTEQISIQAKEGYLTLLPCTEEAFIFIKTKHILNGSLAWEIQRIVKTIEHQLNQSEERVVPPTQFTSSSATEETVNSSKIQVRGNPQFVRYCKQELAEFIGPITTILCQRILKQNSELSMSEFVEALATKIPNPQQAREFKQRISSKYNLPHLNEVNEISTLRRYAEGRRQEVEGAMQKVGSRRQELNVIY